MYVDESGDTGLSGSPTHYFILSGLIVHESNWRELLNTLVAFKKKMKILHGLPVRAEIHSSEFINTRAYNLERYVRLAVLRNSLDELAKINFISLLNIVVDKQGKPPEYDVFHSAWGTLFQRFENTLLHGNFPGQKRDDQGMVLTDATSGKLLTRLVRRMAVYNYVPNQGGGGSRNLPIQRIVEDPHAKDSRDSLPIQMCDVVSYFLNQKLKPNSYIRKSRATDYFDRLNPILNRYASRYDRQGIVKL
jgi:Protein of unknown function (DUF3800)